MKIQRKAIPNKGCWIAYRDLHAAAVPAKRISRFRVQTGAELTPVGRSGRRCGPVRAVGDNASGPQRPCEGNFIWPARQASSSRSRWGIPGSKMREADHVPTRVRGRQGTTGRRISPILPYKFPPGPGGGDARGRQPHRSQRQQTRPKISRSGAGAGRGRALACCPRERISNRTKVTETSPLERYSDLQWGKRGPSSQLPDGWRRHGSLPGKGSRPEQAGVLWSTCSERCRQNG